MKISFKPAACFALLLLCSAAVPPLAAQFVNFEAKQTMPVRLSPDGSRLFAVNTPDHRLSVFDVSNPQNPILMAEIPVGVEPVSVHPVNNDEVWVVNEVSDSVSVVSVSQHLVLDTLFVKDEPADVVFANGRAFVSCARSNQIAVFDQVTRARLADIPVLGENPRSLCVNSNGTRLYAAFALSGNRTTLIPFGSAPPPPAPTNPNLPPPPQVGLIVDATDPNWTNLVQYTMPDNDLVEIDTTTLAVTRYFSRVGTVNFAVAVRPGSGDLYVANTDARNTTRFEPVLRGGFVTNQVSRVDLTSGTVTRHDLNPGFAYTNFPNLANQSNALAQPTAIAFEPGGSNFFVTAFGSDRVALVDADSGAVLARIEINPSTPGSAANPRTKRGPRGLALKPGAALYVANRIANTLTVIDPVTRAVVREIPLGSHDPTPAVIRVGRGFLYDAKLSGGGLVSCASCHIDGEMDFLAWDLGDPSGSLATNFNRVGGTGNLTPGGFVSNIVFHPMKGPMVTQTLRGLQGLDPLHWRGDRTNFLHFNGAFDSLLGGTVLSASDMAAYRAFINTMVFQPNPNQTLNRRLPESLSGGDPALGRTAYLNTNFGSLLGLTTMTCNACHGLLKGTEGGFTPAQALQKPQDFKVPHLRNIYQKTRFNNAPGAQSLMGFGLTHEGTSADIPSFLTTPFFGALATNGVVRSNISAFVLCFDTGTAPAVGYALSITSGNVTSLRISNDWSTLEAQTVGGTNIDLIVKGTIDGRLQGFVFVTASNLYRGDQALVPGLTRSNLVAKILAGGHVTIMGVPPGTGVRAGIDRNADGLLDGDTPPPLLKIQNLTTNVIVAWSTNAGGFVLEAVTTVPTTNWAAETSLRAIVGSEFNITNSPPPTNRYFRLKEL